MGFRIGRVFRRAFRAVTGFASGVLKSTGLGKILGPFTGIFGKILNKLPFANLLKPVLGFLGNLGPLAFLAGGPFGMIAGLLSKASTLASVASFAKNLMGGMGGPQNVDPRGLMNFAEVAAKNHARFI